MPLLRCPTGKTFLDRDVRFCWNLNSALYLAQGTADAPQGTGNVFPGNASPSAPNGKIAKLEGQSGLEHVEPWTW